MANSVAFEWLCDQLEAATSMTRLESRGTVRLALKSAGLEPATVSRPQVKVVVERILPGELEAKGTAGGEEICEKLARQLDVAELTEARETDTPESVFARLGGS